MSEAVADYGKSDLINVLLLLLLLLLGRSWAGCLAGWLAGCLAGWLAGSSPSPSSPKLFITQRVALSGYIYIYIYQSFGGKGS